MTCFCYLKHFYLRCWLLLIASNGDSLPRLHILGLEFYMSRASDPIDILWSTMVWTGEQIVFAINKWTTLLAAGIIQGPRECVCWESLPLWESRRVISFSNPTIGVVETITIVHIQCITNNNIASLATKSWSHRNVKVETTRAAEWFNPKISNSSLLFAFNYELDFNLYPHLFVKVPSLS